MDLALKLMNAYDVDSDHDGDTTTRRSWTGAGFIVCLNNKNNASIYQNTSSKKQTSVKTNGSFGSNLLQ